MQLDTLVAFKSFIHNGAHCAQYEATKDYGMQCNPSVLTKLDLPSRAILSLNNFVLEAVCRL